MPSSPNYVRDYSTEWKNAKKRGEGEDNAKRHKLRRKAVKLGMVKPKDGKDIDQEQMIRGLSIVANIGIIADSLDQNSPALTDVVTPDEPAKDKVLKVSPRKQSRKYWNRFKKGIRKYF
jgi:hypothetical protein